MRTKGHGELEPLGLIEVDDQCWYFYFLLPGGETLVELEVILEPQHRRFVRRVTAMVTDPAEMRDLLPA